MARFDEIEFEPAIVSIDDDPAGAPAPRLKRMMALLTDLSLFGALVLALSPLLPASMHWTIVVALSGFVFVVSYYYFVGTWMLWGRTIGGVIFDVRVVPDGPHAIALRNATMRWSALYLSLLTGGIGFLFALFPSRRSLADRMSQTRCVSV